MTVLHAVALYLLTGAITAALVGRSPREGGALGALARLARAVLLWPSVLPFLFAAQPVVPRASPRAGGLARREQAMREAVRRAAAVPDCERIHAVAVKAAGHLRALDERLTALRAAIDDAPEGVAEQLSAMWRRSEAEFQTGLSLLDALAGKLTVLAFRAEGAGGELREVQALLQRLEALAEASEEVAGLG